MHDGLVFRGKRLVIPKSIQPEMTKTLHSSHIHVVRVPIWRARECLYWPYMNAKMKQHIAACETCNRHAVRQQNETLVSHEITERPWEKVGSDLFTIQGKEYLILVNWFSNFWEIDYLRDTRATTCIKKIKSNFAIFFKNSIPETFVSDNGPQFTSDKFATFAQEWRFGHTTCSPGHQQANGKAEAAVKMAKYILRKATESGWHPFLAILALRNHTHGGDGFQPITETTGKTDKGISANDKRAFETQRNPRRKNYQTNYKSPRETGTLLQWNGKGFTPTEPRK